MDIHKVTDKIISWAESNDIAIFHGIIDTNKTIKVIWEIEEEFEKFLNISKIYGVKSIIVSKSLFNINNEIDFYTFESTKNIGLRNAINKLYNDFEKRNGELNFCLISWIRGGVAYECPIWGDLHDEFESRKSEIVKAYPADIIIQAGRIRTHFEVVTGEQNLSFAEIKDFAEKLASHLDYYTMRYNSSQQKAALSVILEDATVIDKVGLSDSQQIISEANIVFDRKYVLQREKELQVKIEELKAQGLTKVAIRAKLGLSQTQINKLWL